MASLGLSQLIFWRGNAAAAARPSSTTGFFSASFTTRKVTAAVSSSSITFSPVIHKPPPPKISPWLMLPPSFDGTDLVYDFYDLAENRVVSVNKKEKSDPESESDLPDDDARVVGMSHGWLACHNSPLTGSADGDGNIFLSNPISRRHIKLPPGLNLPFNSYNRRSGFVHVENVFVSSHDPADPNCRAVMIYGPGKRLAFCCPARSSDWIPFSDKKNYCSTAFSATRNVFFCLRDEEEEEDGGIEFWDLSDLESPKMTPMEDFYPEFPDHPVSCSSEQDRDAKCFFIPTTSLAITDKSEDLYQIRRFTVFRMGPDGSHVKNLEFCDVFVPDVLPYKTTDFDVYKYDEEANDWKYMDGCLDGMTFFVGKNAGFALSAGDYPELKPDAIYFTDISEFTYGWGTGDGHDNGIFNYRDKTLSPCYYPCDYESIKSILPPPLWFTPNSL